MGLPHRQTRGGAVAGHDGTGESTTSPEFAFTSPRSRLIFPPCRSQASPLLQEAGARLREAGGGMQREGAQIYAQKPNLGQRGITWSQENYAHLGLQARSPPDLTLISPHLHRGPGSPLPPPSPPGAPWLRPSICASSRSSASPRRMSPCNAFTTRAASRCSPRRYLGLVPAPPHPPDPDPRSSRSSLRRAAGASRLSGAGLALSCWPCSPFARSTWRGRRRS